MGFIIAAAVAAAVIAFCFLCYKNGPADQAIVVTGFGLSRRRSSAGAASLCCPLCSAQTA